MAWRRANFRGQTVWAEVDGAGALAASSGRVAIRYAATEGAKLYRAGAAGVVLSGDGPVDLPAGVDADAAGGAPRTAAKGARAASGFGSAATRTADQAARAVNAASDLVRSLGPDAVLCWTDGGCEPNPGPAGSGAFVRLPDGRVARASRSLGRGTNNIGELDAVALALDVIEAAGVGRGARVAIMTDSKYAHGVLALGWKATANRERVLAIRAQLAGWPNASLHWVAGHAGVDGNEEADRLASSGIAGRTAVTWA